MHELPNNVDDASQSSALPTDEFQSSSLQTESLVNAALLACIEYLETQNILPETNIHLQRLTSGSNKMIA